MRFGSTEEDKAKGNFGFAAGAGLALSLTLLVPYHIDGELDVEWLPPWMATFAFLPVLAWYAWHAPTGRRRTLWTATGMALGAAALVAVWWNLWEGLPGQWGMRGIIEAHPDWTVDVGAVIRTQQVLNLMMLHWPLLLLGLTGWAWIRSSGEGDRVDFLRHALQVGLYSALIAGGGALFTVLSVQLCGLVGLDGEEVAVHLLCWGGCSVILFGHQVWMRYPQALDRILPLIAALFVPLFVLLEAGFLGAYLAKGFTELSADREQLLFFNLLLIAVIGLVLLHAALDHHASRLARWAILILVLLGIAADGVALGAIGTRLWAWGLTPNRFTVLIVNLLCMLTLLRLVPGLRSSTKGANLDRTRLVLNQSLPLFIGWSAWVAVVWPLQRWAVTPTESVQLCIAAHGSALEAEMTERTLASLHEQLVMTGAQGTLFIIGGGRRPLELMQGMVDRLPSKDALVIVLPMASSEPDTSAHYGIRPLAELGCTNVVAMNLQPGTYGNAQLDSLSSAAGIYLCGGDQARFMDAAEGAVADAIRSAFRSGAVVAGSSAGAAMMSRVMITGDQVLEPEYERTYARIMAGNGIYGEGLGLLTGAIIDQHFVERSRYNRALSVLHDHPGLPVYGIGESTALVVAPEGVTVEGSGQVVVFGPNAGRTNGQGLLAFDGLEVDILFAGDTLR